MSKAKGLRKDMGNGLEALKTLDVPPAPLPKAARLTVRFSDADREGLRKEAETVGKEAQFVQEDCLTALQNLAWYANQPPNVQERPEAKKMRDESEAYLAQQLGHEEPAFKTAAFRMLFQFYLSENVKSRPELEAAVNELVKRGALVVSANGTALPEVGNRRYAVAPVTGFDDSTQKVEIAYRLIALLAKTRWQKVVSPEGETLPKLCLAEFMEGKTGTFTMNVLPEPIPLKTGETEENRRWRSGGLLTVRSDGKVCPVSSSEKLNRTVETAKKVEIFVFLESLKRDKPPHVSLPKDQETAFRGFWFLLKRGLTASQKMADEADTKAAEMNELAEKATISADAFFLKREAGICLVEFTDNQGRWKISDTEILYPWLARDGQVVPHVFFLLERTAEHKLKIVGVPKHLGHFFADCGGEYSDDFDACPFPLSTVLKAVFGQTANAARRRAQKARKEMALEAVNNSGNGTNGADAATATETETETTETAETLTK